MASFLPKLVPDRVAQHRHYPKLIQAVRIVQFVSAIVSLGLFARYLATLGMAISHANGAVVGILVAAVVWVLIITLVGCLVPLGGMLIQLIVLVFDTAFVGAFIGVAALTSPGMGSAGRCPGGGGDDDNDNGNNNDNDNNNANMATACNLVAGTFGLSIVSTLMHFISGLMQQGHISTPSKINSPLSNGGFSPEVAQASYN